MKIHIIAMPRTASKAVMTYFSSYLREKYKDIVSISDLEYGISDRSLDEMLNVEHFRWFKYRVKLENPYEIILTREKIDSIDSELNRRLDIIRNLDAPYVAKYFPKMGYETFAEQILTLSDRNYYIRRSDMFNHSLSMALSVETNSWIKDNYQNSVIEAAKNNPIRLRRGRYTNIVKWLIYYDKHYTKNNPVIEFEDIISVDSAETFCDLFNLEYIDFEFKKYPAEFVDNKLQMISNINDLRNVFEEEIKNPDALLYSSLVAW
jgi:hypothetical protein